MFRQSTAQSPHQFMLHRRVQRAKEMLRDAEKRVLDVVVACGFQSQQHKPACADDAASAAGLQARFGLRRVVLVGDRGTATSENLELLRSSEQAHSSW
jgi:transcriptional regulator GlxA family with amidase domain